MRKTLQQIILAAIICTLAATSVHAQDAAAKYQLRQYEKFRLPNGLTVYLMEKHSVPVISISAIIPAGAVYDNARAGIASLTAECLKCATKSYTKSQIEEAFDFAGANFNTYGTKEFASLTARLAVKDEDRQVIFLHAHQP